MNVDGENPEAQTAHVNNETVLDWLQLWMSSNVGPITFTKLITRYGSAQYALEALTIKPQHNITICPRSRAIKQLDQAHKLGTTIILKIDPRYPKNLAFIEDSPPLLFALGNITLLTQNNIAIVGARSCSANGARFAYQLAHDLSQSNFTIVSGMARGIDTSAHTGAIDNRTIAVLASSVDDPYPPENIELYNKIKDHGGLIVSEMPFGTVLKGQLFPRRNRIISGLSYGVAVIESNRNSGSLITAQYALDQNKSVFAVPGFPLDPRYHGNNHLLKQGAHLLESCEDIINMVKTSINSNKANIQPDLLTISNEDKNTQRTSTNTHDPCSKVLTSINFHPTDINEIGRQLKIDTSQLLKHLSQLELEEKIKKVTGNKVVRIF